MPPSFLVRLAGRWRASLACFVLLMAGPVLAVAAEPLRIAYTSIAAVYGPLWLTHETGLFKKYPIDPESIYIAGDVSIALAAKNCRGDTSHEDNTRSSRAP